MFQSAAATWAQEEEQHGIALGRWADLADSTFDFDAAFTHFKDLYRIPVDATHSVLGSRSGELCARCVVESGTSSFYSAIRDAVDEPVLQAICRRIASDEYRHYQLFARHLARYQTLEPLTVWQRLKVVVSRFKETSDDELASAYHAGNPREDSYNCKRASNAYAKLAMALYTRDHVRTAGRMMAKAVGLAPEAWLTRVFTRVLWWGIALKGRKLRASIVTH